MSTLQEIALRALIAAIHLGFFAALFAALLLAGLPEYWALGIALVMTLVDTKP